MVEDAERRYGSITQFTDSQLDRKNILTLKMVPTLRNKLGSLTRKDRFAGQSMQTPERHPRSPSLSMYLRSQKHKDKVQVRIRDESQGEDSKVLLRKPDVPAGKLAGLYHSRPLSIADSEIQQASDLDVQVLNHEMSLASLTSNVAPGVRLGMQAQLKRRQRPGAAVGILTQIKDHEQSKTNITSLPDINDMKLGRLIQIDQVNIE